MYWKKVTLVGVGLLGGSLGLALKQRRLAREVTGFVRRQGSIAECLKVGAVDHATLDIAEAVSGANLVVFCTPVFQMQPLLQDLLPAIAPDAIVTDVGSVKRCIVRDLEAPIARAKAHFVGSHPMAGSEKSGVLSAAANLFEGAVCVVTPTSKTNPTALKRVEELWRSVGGSVLRMTPARHDKLVSRSSHLPHLVAGQLARHVLPPSAPKEQALLCATGFRDTTRIASGSPAMWKDIILGNADYLSEALRTFAANAVKLSELIERRDAAAIDRFLRSAKSARDSWKNGACSTSQE